MKKRYIFGILAVVIAAVILFIISGSSNSDIKCETDSECRFDYSATIIPHCAYCNRSDENWICKNNKDLVETAALNQKQKGEITPLGNSTECTPCNQDYSCKCVNNLCTKVKNG